MTPEGKVKERVKALLKRFGVYYHMPVMNGMGAPTLDFVCCAWGFYLTIETKAPGQKATARQELTMGQVREARGVALVVGHDEHSFVILESCLRLLRAMVNDHQQAVLSAHLELMGHDETTAASARAGVRRPEKDAQEAGDRPRRRARNPGQDAQRSERDGQASSHDHPRRR